MIISAVCFKGVHTGGASAATRVVLRRWQDTMPSRQQELPEIEEEARKTDEGWGRVITKRDNMKENMRKKEKDPQRVVRAKVWGVHTFKDEKRLNCESVPQRPQRQKGEDRK